MDGPQAQGEPHGRSEERGAEVREFRPGHLRWEVASDWSWPLTKLAASLQECILPSALSEHHPCKLGW